MVRRHWAADHTGAIRASTASTPTTSQRRGDLGEQADDDEQGRETGQRGALPGQHGALRPESSVADAHETPIKIKPVSATKTRTAATKGMAGVDGNGSPSRIARSCRIQRRKPPAAHTNPDTIKAAAVSRTG